MRGGDSRASIHLDEIESCRLLHFRCIKPATDVAGFSARALGADGRGRLKRI